MEFGRNLYRMKVDTEVKSAVRRINDRFLRLGKGTPVHEIKVKLGPKRSALNTLLDERIIQRAGDKHYLPCLRSILEFEHPDLQHLYMRATARILNA